jgi:hypothetical protein
MAWACLVRRRHEEVDFFEAGMDFRGLRKIPAGTLCYTVKLE